jgi:hypothetical protein
LEQKQTLGYLNKIEKKDTQKVSANSSILEQLAAGDDSFGTLRPPTLLFCPPAASFY